MNTLTLEQVAAWDGPSMVLFVGVDTGGSLAHTVFDGWARVLERPWVLRGVDLPADTASPTYQRLLAAARDNPAVHGAVITAHKLRLYQACAADLARRDHLVEVTHEVNTLAATDGTVAGYARDALSLGRVLPDVPHVLCLGAGGAGTALLLALRGLDPPPPVVFADTDPRALDALRAVAARAGGDPDQLSLVPIDRPEDSDALVAGLPDRAVVINATGLGKDAPGSPVTDQAPFRPDLLAWDFNYRGTLGFLRQAAARGTPTMDGWDYFVAGWAGALTAIAATPFTDDLLDRFRQSAAPYRPAPAP